MEKAYIHMTNIIKIELNIKSLEINVEPIDIIMSLRSSVIYQIDPAISNNTKIGLLT